ncbi:hypothetical protein TRIP_B200081 [uncultured Desulfatiglans sp.]|nr:hypothetical protein TRIP_B200081 [uncultured Desulfatiglans sp.]
MTTIQKQAGLCARCPHKGTCSKLCDRAEQYADQDRVEWGRTITFVDPRRLDYVASHAALTMAEMADSPLERRQWKTLLKRYHLTERQTEVLLLYYYEKKSQEEIAEILTITQRAVAYRVDGAKKKIRKILLKST